MKNVSNSLGCSYLGQHVGRDILKAENTQKYDRRGRRNMKGRFRHDSDLRTRRNVVEPGHHVSVRVAVY